MFEKTNNFISEKPSRYSNTQIASGPKLILAVLPLIAFSSPKLFPHFYDLSHLSHFLVLAHSNYSLAALCFWFYAAALRLITRNTSSFPFWAVTGGNSKRRFTCGILKSLSKFATCIDVTLEAAPTTPDITFLTWVLLQWYSAPSMLLIEPEIQYTNIYKNVKVALCGANIWEGAKVVSWSAKNALDFFLR